MNGKGSRPRKVNRAAWDGAEYWKRLEKRKSAQVNCRICGKLTDDLGGSSVCGACLKARWIRRVEYTATVKNCLTVGRDRDLFGREVGAVMTLKEYMLEIMDNLDNPARLAELGYTASDKDCGYRAGLRYLGLEMTPETDAVCQYVIYDRFKPVDNQLTLF